MMQALERLLQFLDLETLVSSLLDLREDVEMLPKANLTSVTGASSPKGWHDFQLLKSTIPAPLFAEMRGSGLMGSFTMSYALRHQVCYAQQLLHQRRRIHTVSHEQDSGLCYFGKDHHHALKILEGVLTARGLEQKELLLGFSAAGIHWTVRPRGACRAFDAWDIAACSLKTEGLFCEVHQNEAWWLHDQGSRQAKMYKFYADRSHYAEYEDQSLEKIVHDFWQSFQGWQESQSRDQLGPALAQFSLGDDQELLTLGEQGLRRRFHQWSRKTHPDLGGDAQDFLLVKGHYELLKRRLLYLRS